MKRLAMKRLAIFAVGLLALTSAARAETLVMAPYPDARPWKKITDQRNAQLLLMEWIPADQSQDAIKDILTQQAFYSLKGKDPVVFVDGLLRRISGACVSVRTNGPVAATENGYAIAYAQAYCLGQKGAAQDVDVFIKAISGADALYLAQREFHRPARVGGKTATPAASKIQVAAIKARLTAETAATRYLTSQVQLCPPVGGGSCQDGPTLADGLPPAAGAVVADAPVVSSAAASPSKGEDSIPPFVNGVYTTKDVVKVLGQPSSQNHNPDGRFAYLYQGKDGTVAAFLFDKKGVLIRARTYAKNQ